MSSCPGPRLVVLAGLLCPGPVPLVRTVLAGTTLGSIGAHGRVMLVGTAAGACASLLNTGTTGEGSERPGPLRLDGDREPAAADRPAYAGNKSREA